MMLRRAKLALVATGKENDINLQTLSSNGLCKRMLLKRVTLESSFEIFDMFYVDEMSMF